jgi:hypothetical protein
MDGTVTFGVIAFVAFLLPLTALISAIRTPRWRWDTAGKSKELWVIIEAVALVLPIGGGFLGLFYWFMVQPNLKRARQGIGFPGHH